VQAVIAIGGAVSISTDYGNTWADKLLIQTDTNDCLAVSKNGLLIAAALRVQTAPYTDRSIYISIS
jgi:hypothetical protein